MMRRTRSLLAGVAVAAALGATPMTPALGLTGVGGLIDVGNYPLHTAITPNGKFALTTVPVTETVAITKVTSNRIVKTVTITGFGPETVQVFNNGRTALVFGQAISGPAVTIVSVKSGTHGSIFPVNANALACTLTPANDVFLCPTATSTELYAYSVSTGELVDTYNLGTSGEGILFTKGGKTAYIIDAGSDSVVVFNMTTHQPITSIPVDDYPTWSALSPNGKRLYVPDDNNADLRVVNTKTNAVVDTIAFPGLCGAASATVSPDGKRLYVPCHISGVLYAVNTATNEIVESESVIITAGICDVDIAKGGKVGYVTIDAQSGIGKLRFP